MDNIGNKFLEIYNVEYAYLSSISQIFTEPGPMSQEQPDIHFLFRYNLHRMINVFYQRNRLDWGLIHQRLSSAFQMMREYIDIQMIQTQPYDSLISNTVLTVLQLTDHVDTNEEVERSESIGFLKNIIKKRIRVRKIDSELLSQLKATVVQIFDTILAIKIYNKINNCHGQNDSLEQTHVHLKKLIDMTFSSTKNQIWSVSRLTSQKVEGLTTYDCQMFLSISLVDSWILDDTTEQVQHFKVGEALRVILHEFSHIKRIVSDNYDYLKGTPPKLLSESGCYFDQSLVASSKLFKSPEHLLNIGQWTHSQFVDICADETQQSKNQQTDKKSQYYTGKVVCGLSYRRDISGSYQSKRQIQSQMEK